MNKSLSKESLGWLDQRGISIDTACAAKAYSSNDGFLGPGICFPYTLGDKTLGASLIKTNFVDDAGHQERTYKGTPALFNGDILDDTSLSQSSRTPLVITINELDTLSLIEAGHPWVVGLPDTCGEYDFLQDKRLNQVQKIVIAIPSSQYEIAQDVVIRLGAARCSYVTFPEESKISLNDILVSTGKPKLHQLIINAKEWPVKGLYRLSEYPDEPAPVTYDTGFPGLEQCFKPYLGSLIVVTGIPSHGKSTFVTAAIINLCKANDWAAAIGSFESKPVPFFRARLRHYLTKTPTDRQTYEQKTDADAWINDHLIFIDNSVDYDDENDADIDWILEKAYDAVVRHNIKILCIDPWNEIEHKRGRDESETEYIGRAIRALKRFARQTNTMIWVVVHPTKPNANEGVKKPHMYSIASSAHWYNKPDHGIVVYRPDRSGNEVEIDIQKVREAVGGYHDSKMFSMNEWTGHYSQVVSEEESHEVLI